QQVADQALHAATGTQDGFQLLVDTRVALRLRLPGQQRRAQVDGGQRTAQVMGNDGEEIFAEPHRLPKLLPQPSARGALTPVPVPAGTVRALRLGRPTTPDGAGNDVADSLQEHDVLAVEGTRQAAVYADDAVWPVVPFPGNADRHRHGTQHAPLPQWRRPGAARFGAEVVDDHRLPCRECALCR